jgi:hypothetical protein
MCPDLWTILNFLGWLRTNEQSIAIWLEGIALVAIFILELVEYKRQGREGIEQHRESAAQMAILQSQADAAIDETELLIRELDQEQYAPAAQTAAELRDFWVSQPQLYDPKWGDNGKQGEVRTSVTGLDIVRSGAFGLAKQCDSFVKHVAAKKTNQ